MLNLGFNRGQLKPEDWGKKSHKRYLLNVLIISASTELQSAIIRDINMNITHQIFPVLQFASVLFNFYLVTLVSETLLRTPLNLSTYKKAASEH